MRRAFPALLCCALISSALGQLQGDTVVCAGNMYTYTADIPGAVTYEWNFPSYWYDASGLGTASVTVTCNGNPGGVCATGVDGLGNVVGQQCLVVLFGGGGSGLDLIPSTYEGCGSASVSFSMVPNGTGGGCSACGGTTHPNVAWALYDNSYFPFAHFLGLVDGGSYSVFPPGQSFNAFLVDMTNGLEYPQAIVLEGGCGGSGSTSVGVAVVPIVPPVFEQEPEEVCIGDTVTVTEMNGPPDGFGASWDGIAGMDVLINGNPMVAIVTGPNASAAYHGIISFCPMEEASYAIQYCSALAVNETHAMPVLRTLGDHSYAITGAGSATVKVMNAAGQLVLRANAQLIDVAALVPGLYMIDAGTTGSGAMRWKVMR